MAKLAIGDIFPGAITYLSDGTVGINGARYVMLNVEDFYGLENVEAEVTTGDAGEFLRQLMFRYEQAMFQIDAADLPKNFAVTVANLRGTSPNRVDQTMTGQFKLAVDPRNVSIAPEA